MLKMRWGFSHAGAAAGTLTRYNLSRMHAEQKGDAMRGRYWHVLLGVFFLGWVFMYADRTVLSPVLSQLGSEWQLNSGQLGLISSIFFLSYAALQIPTGLLADRFGRKVLLVPGYLLFGATTALGAIAPSYGLFLLLGTLTGIGEGTYFATQFSLSSEAIPARFRGLGSAIINSGQAFGISLGFVLSSYVAFTLRAGWRASYGTLGVATMAAGIVIWIVVREHPPSERAPANKVPIHDPAGTAATPAHAGLLRGLFTRDLLLAYAVMFCSLYGFFVILTWLPYYLQVARHMPPGITGIISSLVPWASIPGALFFSHLSDRTGRRREFALGLLPAAAAALILIPLVPNQGVLFAALIAYGLLGKLALDPIMVAFVADRVPRAAYSSAFALFNFAGMLSSILGPLVTGVLRDRWGTLEVGFFLAAALLLLGALCMAFTRPEQRGTRLPARDGQLATSSAR